MLEHRRRVGWLVWHLTRVQDDHIAEVVNLPQIWVTGGWHQRFGLDAGTLETGYGHSRRQMARVRPDSADALIEYYDDVAARTGEFLAERIAPAHVAQRLLANFFNSIRERLSLPQDGQPVWGWLAEQASVADADLQALRRLHARAQAGQRIDLIALQNCLTSITGKLT